MLKKYLFFCMLWMSNLLPKNIWFKHINSDGYMKGRRTSIRCLQIKIFTCLCMWSELSIKHSRTMYVCLSFTLRLKISVTAERIGFNTSGKIPKCLIIEKAHYQKWNMFNRKCIILVFKVHMRFVLNIQY